MKKKNNKNADNEVNKKKEVGKKLMGGKEASRILGVHQRTLYQWEEKGKIDTIRTPGGKRLYNVEKYLREQGLTIEENNDVYDTDLDALDKKKGKLRISYARVSSRGQKDDLERQKRLIKEKYPDHILIEDMGSGMNFNKRGLRKIIKLAIEGRVEELVVAYKDRLTRVGYELIEDLIKEYSGGRITIIEKKDELEPEESLVYDVLQIMNIFVAKMNGLRKYRKKEEKK
ncbi:resolvase [Catovirus CTV1]|uniref:Resolvase n=1 Tax=Catovirus CTV1 TaxID=1977631 RepID=A0A1V0S8F8_9VIRU|nr:resolvase [Catovirus CTV1]